LQTHLEPGQISPVQSPATSARPGDTASASSTESLAASLAVSVAGVSRAYSDPHGAPVQALAGITLHARAGKLLAVVGPSGCGKTTLLELICGLQTPDEGRIECVPAVLMPQRDLLLPWLDALDNAALALRISGDPRPRARARAGTPLF
jgi:ABC-type nitrate/sulfonate/bicarbonate transport system ATPase subunit